jgi:hypothetical protein
MKKALTDILGFAAIWCVCMGSWRIYEGTFGSLKTVVALFVSGLLCGFFLLCVSWALEKWVRKKYSDKNVDI